MKLYPQRRLSSFAGFTLIELLVVMAIIAILAALLIPATGIVSKAKIQSRARGQISELVTAIDRYQAKKGFYPPDNKLNKPGNNQLVYELWGALSTTAAGVPAFTIDFGQGETIRSVPTLTTFFGTPGIMNSSAEKKEIDNFIEKIKMEKVKNINNDPNEPVWVFFSPSKGPNDVPDINNSLINLINYVSSSPKHNPNTYDLWIDVIIGGKTNRISNWSNEPERGVGPY
ncbi:type II secretion system protein [Pedosphaera parvula]|uniref:Prepilin-type N-terminal cleavage/methylation domain-containing protein n=1 Tax=Pedosphaera parvula (strain Ellin514) TaxID=320771 RepID=B9XLW3_PEDPL|nr:prepilin-type N-terminal cleavage/methylation domain-containing protein [Pedosphaera parvula]EEF59220.1 hypothetical protein Cflav_PD2425 [Pedosphaera parvula Ellin514]